MSNQYERKYFSRLTEKALLLRVVPPPFRPLDYFMIGTVSVMAAVLVVFLVGAKSSFWKT